MNDNLAALARFWCFDEINDDEMERVGELFATLHDTRTEVFHGRTLVFPLRLALECDIYKTEPIGTGNGAEAAFFQMYMKKHFGGTEAAFFQMHMKKQDGSTVESVLPALSDHLIAGIIAEGISSCFWMSIPTRSFSIGKKDIQIRSDLIRHYEIETGKKINESFISEAAEKMYGNSEVSSVDIEFAAIYRIIEESGCTFYPENTLNVRDYNEYVEKTGLTDPKWLDYERGLKKGTIDINYIVRRESHDFVSDIYELIDKSPRRIQPEVKAKAEVAEIKKAIGIIEGACISVDVKMQAISIIQEYTESLISEAKHNRDYNILGLVASSLFKDKLATFLRLHDIYNADDIIRETLISPECQDEKYAYEFYSTISGEQLEYAVDYYIHLLNSFDQAVRYYAGSSDTEVISKAKLDAEVQSRIFNRDYLVYVEDGDISEGDPYKHYREIDVERLLK